MDDLFKDFLDSLLITLASRNRKDRREALAQLEELAEDNSHRSDPHYYALESFSELRKYVVAEKITLGLMHSEYLSQLERITRLMNAGYEHDKVVQELNSTRTLHIQEIFQYEFRKHAQNQ
jgi:hypothetical protein